MGCISTICMAVFLSCASLCQAQQAGGSTPDGGDATGSKDAPAAVAGIVQRALTLEQQGKYPAAAKAWENVIQLQPRNARAYAQLGLIEARLEQYPQAIAHYRKAEALAQAQNQPIPQLNLNLGLALFKSGDFQEAAKTFEAELSKHPNAANKQKLTELAAMAHYGAHEYSAAIPYLKDAESGDPRNLTLLLTLAHCYLWTKQLDAVLEVYKQILLINPDSAAADMIAGEALDEKGDKTGAVEQFRAAEKANPKEPNVHFGLAYLLWTDKKYDEAISEFKAELENDPNNNQAMIYLGDAYVRQGKFDQGKAVLEKADQYQTSDPLIHLDLGIVHMESGDNGAALKELQKAVTLEPDNITAHFRLATLYRSMGKKEEARVEFAKANSLNKKRDDSVHERIAAANARPNTATQPAQPQKPDAGAKPDQP